MMILGENVATLKVMDSSLRLIVIPLSLASMWLTLTNHEDNIFYGRLEFSNLKGLKFLGVAYLMVASGGSVGEILYLAYNGNTKVTWSEACSSYGRFCSRLNLIMVLHAIAFFCFLVLSLISAFRVFTTYEPPLPSNHVHHQTIQTT